MSDFRGTRFPTHDAASLHLIGTRLRFSQAPTGCRGSDFISEPCKLKVRPVGRSTAKRPKHDGLIPLDKLGGGRPESHFRRMEIK